MGQWIAVTGATGQVGGGVVRRLLERGHAVRAIARSAEKLGRLRAQGVDVRAGDVGDEGFLKAALQDASAAFVMIPPFPMNDRNPRGTQRRYVDAVVSALRSAAVPSAVALSSLGADVPQGTGPIAGLHEFERKLSGLAGVRLTILRPTYFMENHLASIPLVRAMSVLGNAFAPELAFPQIASRDVAAAAADALLDDSAASGVRELLGPRDYSMTDVARALGEAIGKPDLSYRAFPYDAFVGALTQTGISSEVAALYVEIPKAFNEGVIGHEARTAANTTPTALEEVARETFAPAYGSH
jgi:uncharacterized protein YbjT (DUF2867 family)